MLTTWSMANISHMNYNSFSVSALEPPFPILLKRFSSPNRENSLKVSRNA